MNNLYYLICFIAFVTLFTRDIYLPLLPQISQSLNSNNTIILIAFSSSFLVNGIVQYTAGTISDFFGREKVFLWALFIGVMGCLFASMSHSSLFFFISCMFMAASNGSVTSVTMAMLRDKYNGKDLAKAFAGLTACVAISPIIAPNIGSFIAAYINWRGVFIFTAITNALALFLAFLYRKYYVSNQRTAVGFINTKRIIKNKNFTLSAVMSSCAFSSSMVIFALMPFVLKIDFGESIVRIANHFALLAIAFIAGNLLTKKFLVCLDEILFIRYSILIYLLSIFGLILSYTIGEKYALLIFSISLLLITFSNGMNTPLANKLAIEPFHDCAGQASGLLGLIRMLTAFFMCTIFSLWQSHFLSLITAIAIITTILIFPVVKYETN